MVRKYGGRGREWSEAFQAYIAEIISHPDYVGIPCAFDSDGRIDWTIPSNRKPGSKNWDGNERRRAWWADRADELGIPRRGQWLSATARKLHPLQKKPCQTCGRWMSLRYVYPNAYGRRALERAFPGYDFEWEEWAPIQEIVDGLVQVYGVASTLDGVVRSLPLQSASVSSDAGGLQEYVERCVQGQHRRLSPGAMSNCPDRLDGFHTYNLCCRGAQDTGRGRDNMSRYVVDRRAYEQWSQGDLELANAVMQAAGEGVCSDANCPSGGRIVQLTGDHIGPVSLGFMHSPHFSPLCVSCNSAKNNRMSMADVAALLTFEATGQPVMSWQARLLWDGAKTKVTSEAEALLLSRLLRVNQDAFLKCLLAGAESRHPEALVQFLDLSHARQRIIDLDVDPQTLVVRSYKRQSRQGTYVSSRVERMLRVSLDALKDYGSGGARNLHGLDEVVMDKHLRTVRAAFDKAPVTGGPMDLVGVGIQGLLLHGDPVPLARAVDTHYSALLAMDWSPWARPRQAVEAAMEDVQGRLLQRFRDGDHRSQEWLHR